MRTSLISWVFVLGIVLTVHNSALATSPYTEHFASDNANWFMDGAMSIPAVYEPSGGPDSSSHVSIDASAFGQPFDAPVILFQARDEFDSSGHAFEGNWTSSGINQFSAYVRHNASVPLNFFARFTRPTGGAGVAAERAAPVVANRWTKLVFDLDPSNINHPVNNPNGELFVEGGPSLFSMTFANLGHVQIGYSVPAGFGDVNQSFHYQLDRPSIDAVPEPASFVLAAMACCVRLFGRRRRIATK